MYTTNGLVILILTVFMILYVEILIVMGKVNKLKGIIDKLYETNNTMIKLCDHVKEVIGYNADLIQDIHDLTKPEP